MNKWLVYIVLLTSTGSLRAQSILRLSHFDVADGLSQSSVYNIFQDCHGFIWLATGDGLNRYDGKEFVVFKSRFNDTVSSGSGERNINSAIF